MNKSSKQPTPLQKKPFLLQTTFLLDFQTVCLTNLKLRARAGQKNSKVGKK